MDTYGSISQLSLEDLHIYIYIYKCLTSAISELKKLSLAWIFSNVNVVTEHAMNQRNSNKVNTKDYKR